MLRAVKPLPLGGGYKAHLDWNFCLFAFCVLTGDTAAGHAVSACGEIVRPGGIGGWFVPVKFPTWECLRRKPSLVPLGSLVEAGTRSGMQSQDCLRWESPDFRRGRMSKFFPQSSLFCIHCDGKAFRGEEKRRRALFPPGPDGAPSCTARTECFFQRGIRPGALLLSAFFNILFFIDT